MFQIQESKYTDNLIVDDIQQIKFVMKVKK